MVVRYIGANFTDFLTILGVLCANKLMGFNKWFKE